ncbi:hypothetical protein Tam1G_1311 [Bifidobacterium imperatoris]|uniref:Uncharacterized protein n=1 Tax=Bifidobacterium imperatoris TaxID=2020965 RepID=A0A2N5IRY6_9BIFI|nr:hypothetical protein Tam1G_1311 [Bifidobacterium imperatoris]
MHIKQGPISLAMCKRWCSSDNACTVLEHYLRFFFSRMFTEI